MNTLLNLLKLALLVYSVYSVIAYFSRRSDNRTAFQVLKEAPIVRELTAAEALALKPFLTTAGVAPNSDPGVRCLGGQFVRHGLYGNGSTSEHNTIGDVDVWLPYDAINFVEDYNECEVVLGKNFAVVVNLNGFTVTDGRQRSLSQLLVVPGADFDDGDDGDDGDDLQLSDAGEVHPALMQAPLTPAAQADARYHAGATDVLAERVESAEEVARRRRGNGWDFVWRCATAFILMWIASWESAVRLRTWFLVGAFLMLAWSVWCLVRKPNKLDADATPQPVQQIRGMLRHIAMVSAGNNQTAGSLFLGDSTMFKLPSHWNVEKLGLMGRVIDADVRTCDHKVLGLGHGWSITDESCRFPDVIWGRYLSLFAVGLLAWFTVWLNAPPPGTQASLAWGVADRHYNLALRKRSQFCR